MIERLKYLYIDKMDSKCINLASNSWVKRCVLKKCSKKQEVSEPAWCAAAAGSTA